MKTKLLIIVLTFIYSFVNAQTPPWQWAKGAGGVEVDQGSSIATDASGNVYVTGAFGSSSVSFGSTTLTNSGHLDVFITKYDPAGNVLWAQRAGGAGDDYATGITTDGSGNVYVTGYFVSASITFGSTTLTSGGNGCAFTVKYDASGNALWAKSSVGYFYDYATGIAVDAAGNVYVTGYFEGSTIAFGSITLTHAGPDASGDIFTVKYDASGNVLWAQSIGGTSTDYAKGIATGSNGNVYITGGFNSASITFGSFTLTNPYTFSPMVFTVALDSSGTALWAKSSIGYASSTCIAIDGNNNAYIAGAFNTPLTFGGITLSNSDNSNTTSDIFTVKYDASGNVLWAKSAGGALGDYATGITTDGSSNVYETGYFNSSTVTFGSTILTNALSTGSTGDIFAVKYDASGNVQWAERAGGDDDDRGLSIASAGSDNVYLTGEFGSSSIAFGSTSLTRAGNYDLFTAKLGTIATGIGEETSSADVINIYPNPSTGIFKISTTKSNDMLDVYNVLGAKVFEKLINNPQSTTEIDLSGYPKGVYFLKINEEDATYTTKRLIIQ